MGLISRAIISFIAVCGILWLAVTKSKEHNTTYGIVVGITYIILVFILVPFIMPLIMREGDKFIKKHGVVTTYNWHKYTFGILTIIGIILVETVLFAVYDIIIR